MTEPAKQELKGLSQRNIYIALVIGLLVSGFLIYRTFDYATFLEIEWQGDLLFFLGLSLLLMVVRHFLYVYRVWLVTGKEMRFRQAFESIVMWEFASAATPGIVGGAAVAMFILNKEKISMGKSTGSVMLITFMDNLFFIVAAIMLFALVGLESMFAITEGCGEDMNLPLLGYIGGIQYVFLFGITFSAFLSGLLAWGLLGNPRALKLLLLNLTKWKLFSRWRDKAKEVGDDILVTAKEFRGKKAGFWLRVFVVTTLAWSCKYLVVNALISAFGDVSAYDQVIIMSRMLVLWLVMLIPITPGSSGLAEITFLALMCSYVDAGLAGTITFLWRMLTYYPYLILGAILMPRWLARVYNRKRKSMFSTK